MGVAPTLIADKRPQPPAVAPEDGVSAPQPGGQKPVRDEVDQIAAHQPATGEDRERGQSGPGRMGVLRVLPVGVELRLAPRSEEPLEEARAADQGLADARMDGVHPLQAEENVARVKRVGPADIAASLSVRPRAVRPLIGEGAIDRPEDPAVHVV